MVDFLTTVLPIFNDPAIRTISMDLLALKNREPEMGQLIAGMAEDRSGPLKTMIERGQARREIRDDLDYLTMLDLIEGPLLSRSIMWPDTLAGFDVAAHVDRVMLVLAAS